MKTQKNTIMLLVIIAGFLLPLLISAGNSGIIKGVITDKISGDPIHGVTVQVIGTSLSAMSDSNGVFIIYNVPPGTQNLKFTATGFSAMEISSISIRADITTEVNIEMEPLQAELDKPNGITLDKEGLHKTIPGIVSETPGKKFQGMGELKIRRDRGQGIIVQDNCIATPYTTPPPAHGGTSIVNGEPFDAMFFKNYGTNPFVDTEDDHLSTFAIDVDDASFVMARSYLERGHLPPNEAIRTEEFINHFTYNYAKPDMGRFLVEAEGGPSYFGQNSKLLKIGIQGMQIDPGDRKSANLIFVIDISGSMGRENRLGLVKKSLTMLVDQLEEGDLVGIVVYGSRGRILLEPTSIYNKKRIIRAIRSLNPTGSTNAEEGLRLGYKMANRCFNPNKINRIILCSDGVANVGTTSHKELLKWISNHARHGITLTTVGFGMGNYNDILMEQLGNKGNGMYAYVDDFEEARRVFMENLTGMLQVIARDVKIQVDFDPRSVRSYRLLGYENRNVADNKFRDDKEDGGEIGAGHQVTALYEVKFHKFAKTDHVATVYIRYKHPDFDEVKEISGSVLKSDFSRRFKNCSTDFKLAACAAEFAEILGDSYWARDAKLSDVYGIVRDIARMTESPQVMELMNLIERADRLEDTIAER
jgi:Ca-activated chloride channel family protein